MAKALYDVGKLVLAFVVLAFVVLGPFASPTGGAVKTAAVGLAFTVIMFASAIVVDKGGEQK